jgi:hypothetical protein
MPARFSPGLQIGAESARYLAFTTEWQKFRGGVPIRLRWALAELYRQFACGTPRQYAPWDNRQVRHR